MEGPLEQVRAGQTFNIFDNDHLTQVQHKGDRVEIVDHFDHEAPPLPVHIVTTVDKQGEVDADFS